ncbi:LysE family translocator [Dactylosporangium sp. NPDC048998]|uniref:LysE family translocator n=1 Tax=Dactylosporangium sp. NPDC048998 TaxID=3363976 RepID=UPI00371C47F5
MPTNSLVAFWLLAALLIAVPGADWAFTLGAGLRGRSVLPAVAGLVAGYTVVTAVVAAGVGALVAGSPAAMTALTVAGGAYLMWHGGATLLARPAAPAAVATAPPATPPAPGGGWAVFRRGVGVSGLNPKGLLMFLALLPQFTDPRGSWPVAVQLAALGLTFVATCAAFYTALGTAARTLLAARPRAAGTVTRAAGAAMLLLGAVLLVDRLVG